MKIAIASDNDFVSGHFGRCGSYTIVEIDDSGTEKKVVNRTRVDTPPHQPGMLPGFLHEKGVNVVVAGGMGPRAQQLFQQLNIQPYIGVTGKIEDVLEAFLSGKLESGESLCDQEHGDGDHHHDCHNH